jgi:hypothetical protein
MIKMSKIKKKSKNQTLIHFFLKVLLQLPKHLIKIIILIALISFLIIITILSNDEYEKEFS